MGSEDYRALTSIHMGSSTVVYRARRAADDRPVILKALRVDAERSAEARFNAEVALTRAVAGPGVVAVLSVESHQGRPAMVLEDFGGVALREILARRRLGVAEAVRVALGVADALTRVHGERVIHKDINPANIVWNEATDELKLIDFGIASALTRERPEARGVHGLEGTLAYLAPEQSGRMNRSVDRRSDLYALGATLYELLTGRPPFETRDALGAVHAHMALAPEPPSRLEPKVPKILGALVLKLLAKSAEDRYQSAAGLAADLRRILDALGRGDGRDAPEPFALGSADVAERLEVAEKLYGREVETEELFEAFERARRGAFELFVVGGPPGVGKTRLIREIHRPVVAAKGGFISGKFDQFRRSIPYESLTQAYRRFIRQVLTESDEVVGAWRARFTEVLGAQGALLVDVIPELELLVGPQEPVAALPPAEAETRFRILFRRFFRSLASAEHPLVLFLDDLQWADLPTLQLLELIAGDVEAGHLLLIGAYRDNEVDGAHPLHITLGAIREAGSRVHERRLEPLSTENVRALVEETLRGDSTSAPLADLVHRKTLGNPFFVEQFLEELHSRELLSFDPQARAFRWDIEAIEAAEITDNVVELMSRKLGELDDATRALLGAAALVGNRFELATVAAAEGLADEMAFERLRPALDESFVLPIGRGRYEFLHDRVQQAAAESLDGSRKAALHDAIGRNLLDATSGGDLEERVFEITGHLNEARALWVEPEERTRLARLNMLAGGRSRDAAAYAPAHEHFQIALELAGPSAWEHDRDFAFELHLRAAEAAFLATDFDAMGRLSEVALGGARDLLDKVKVYEVRVNATVARNDLVGAIETTLEILRELGVSLPADPTPAHVLAGLVRTKWALRGRSMEDLAALPRCTDPAVLAAMRLQIGIISSAYYARPNLMPLLAFSLVRQAVRHGIGDETPYALAVWGLVLSTLNDFAGAVAFGELALSLRERVGDKRLSTRTEHVFGAHLAIYKEPLGASREILRRTYREGYESGDVEYCAFSAMMSCAIGLHAGDDLVALEEEMAAFSRAISGLSQATSLYTHQMHHQVALNLLEGGERPWELRGDAYDERQMVRVHEEASDESNLFTYRTLKIWLALLYRRHEEAHEAALLNRAHMDAAASTVIALTFEWFDALVALRVEGRSAKRRVARTLKRLEVWEAMQPANWCHRVALLRAERARVFEGGVAPSVHYERAVTQARAQGFLNDAALAAEMAGRHLLEAGLETSARAYLRDALHLWSRWGARAKVEHLLAEFPDRLAAAEGPPQRRDGTYTASNPGMAHLDAHALTQAADTIAREIVLERVIEALLRIAVEVAGARKALLILAGDDGLRVAAEARVDEEVRVEALDLHLEAYPDHAGSVVRYCIRSGKPVLASDARDNAELGDDPYLAKVRSLLCVPIVQKCEVIAVLHLENELASGVFTDERVELLRTLMSQAAISLENARLYGDLRSLADAQARFVPSQFLHNLDRTSIVDIGLGENVRKEMSVLFSDIRDFTPLVEGMSPDEHISFINSYISHMEPSILENGGFVDSYIGDAIMALFDGAGGGADEAVRAGVGMSKALAELNVRRATGGRPPIRVGVGIHTGLLTLGTIGGPERIKCGVIGTAVNLAARVESLSKHYRAVLLISDRTRARLRDPDAYALRAVNRVYAKGSQIPITLYEVLDAEPEASRQAKISSLTDYREARAAFEVGDFATAAEGMRRCLEGHAAQASGTEDGAAARYLERAERYLAEGAPEGWQGVEALDHK